jgi:catechol 2,3-dioxygenase-like lactoylglutathione lyase family enzyme
MGTPVTRGAHHIGLTVSRLEETAGFFVELLGWKEIRRNNDYPAIFVSDGTTMLSLWATREAPVTAFNKNSNIGLHHVAFRVESEDALYDIHEKLVDNGVSIEFSPELVGPGPAKHMFCYEPGGIRIELVWPGD